jgi:hypothetical protein
MNGSSMRWLAGGERSAAAYLGDGETWRKRKKEASAAGSFIAGGERGSWPQAHTSSSGELLACTCPLSRRR